MGVSVIFTTPASLSFERGNHGCNFRVSAKEARASDVRSDVYSYRSRSFLTACRACRKEHALSSPLAASKPNSFPPRLTGAYRLERATLAKRVAANHTYHWQQLHENTHNASNNSMHNNSSSTSSSNNSLRPRVPRLA